MTSESRQLVLYHTLGCHLCELAHALVAPLAMERGWVLQEIDIADDEELLSSYATRIPVLENRRSGQAIGWPFGIAEVCGLIADQPAY